MATNSDHPTVPPAPADAHFDEKTGIYGFFRRNQKRILYTVGLFTLLTFSVGGPMLATVRGVFETKQPMATIVVGGKQVQLDREDFVYGQAIARSIGTLYTVVPYLDPGDGGSGDLDMIYAILRRVAITEGFGISMDEVDHAIKAIVDKAKLNSATQLAGLRGFGSLAEFRNLMGEAMRIGDLVHLQSLALESSDAAVLQLLTSDREKITFKVATFDEKALEEQLKKAGGLTDEDLKKWLDGKTDAEKNRIQVYDTNRVELVFGAAIQADFDAAQWQDTALKDWKPADDQIKKQYEAEKEARFKLPDNKGYKPADDEAVKAELTELLQIDQVQNYVLGKLREKQNEAMKPANDEQRKANEDWAKRQNMVNEAQQKADAAKAKLAAKPDDPALQAEQKAADEELRLAKEVMPAMETARKDADTKVKQARAAFDFVAEFTALTKDKKGFVVKSFSGKHNAEELKDLDTLKDADSKELGLGQWPQSFYATALQDKGFLGQIPGRTTKATLLYQARDVEVRPLKAWDKLKPLLEGAYFTEKAKTEAEAKKKLMEESLLTLAKAKMPEKVAEIEGKRQKSVDDKLAEWEKQAQADLEKAEKILATEAHPGTQAFEAWTKRRDTLKDQLAKKEDKRKAIDAEVGKQIETDIGTEAKKYHGEVLAAAAAAAGFQVTELPPYSRELSTKPRFDKSYDPTVVYLFQHHAKMKAGESTGMVQDTTNRRWIVGACTKVEPLTPADIERREFETLRKGYGFESFASKRANDAFRQAFTRKALEKRYSYTPPVGEQIVDKDKKDKPVEKDKPAEKGAEKGK